MLLDTVNDEIIVSNAASDAITVYERTASGDTAPIRTLSGSRTQLHVPVGLAVTTDTDGDGVPDDADNCRLTANADQRDADGDGIGSVCDADLNNDCSVNFVDLGIMKGVFFTADPNADLDGNGSVNFGDLGRMKGAFFLPPGPSGVQNLCDPC
jgi:hypothetical protein